jgi:hypothetical protein
MESKCLGELHTTPIHARLPSRSLFAYDSIQRLAFNNNGMSLSRLFLAVAALVEVSMGLSAEKDRYSKHSNLAGTHHITKRWPVSPIGDTAWAKLKCRGNTLFEMMVTDDLHAAGLFDPPLTTAASVWTNWPCAL